MGITFFEDDELITFAQSAMRGVILQDDAPRPRVSRNISMLMSTEGQTPHPTSARSSKTQSKSMKESVDFLKQQDPNVWLSHPFHWPYYELLVCNAQVSYHLSFYFYVDQSPLDV